MSNYAIHKDPDIIQFHIPRWKELPNIDLYLDQIITILDNSLTMYIQTDISKNDKENKIITKTMINNYVKHKILDAPVNKKYNKIHIAKLFVICILKQLYSINDINNLINFATSTTSIEIAYNQFCSELEKAISIIFNAEEMSHKKDITQEQYVLKNVVQSFASKLYVERMYIKKQQFTH